MFVPLVDIVPREPATLLGLLVGRLLEPDWACCGACGRWTFGGLADGGHRQALDVKADLVLG